MPLAKYPHLSKAPIAEAVVELRIAGQPASTEAFDGFASALRSGYPKNEKLQQAAAKFQLGESVVRAEVPVSRIGVRLASDDDKDIVIGSVRSFVVSRLKPYQSWEALVEKVVSAWPTYRAFFAPSKVIRAGVRCINRIDLGEEAVDLDSVFTAGPKIPPDLPQGLGQYSTRVVVPCENGVGVSIAQVLEPPSGDVILDIDAFSELDADPSDEVALRRHLEALHDLRNRAFFASLQKHVWEKYL
jgi:uncharacterized protein (TIGR04255 family)